MCIYCSSGQRDKPFVNDEENNLRTPRPDLLDRPYAPDYAGESFRSQYKVSVKLWQSVLPAPIQHPLSIASSSAVATYAQSESNTRRKLKGIGQTGPATGGTKWANTLANSSSTQSHHTATCLWAADRTIQQYGQTATHCHREQHEHPWHHPHQQQ